MQWSYAVGHGQPKKMSLQFGFEISMSVIALIYPLVVTHVP